MTYKFEEISAYVKDVFQKNKGRQDWDHTERVLHMAEKLAAA